MIQLYKGDCLEVMKSIADKSIDAIITDPPYGTTACKWDSVIPFDLMWEQLNRIIKPNGAIVLFGSQPFTSALVMSNPKMFKYEWIWDKQRTSNPMLAKIQPMKTHENILLFGNGIYNPQFTERKNEETIKRDKRKNGYNNSNSDHFELKYTQRNSNEYKYPESVIRQKRDNGNNQFAKGLVKHPTQKPVALMEYLIKTYTNETETVLDFTMGSGTTGVACINTKRNFIGIEMDDKYFEIAEKRIKEAQINIIDLFNAGD
jgi:site-specific DNA-methyltransferase (adenine-specific)